MKRLGAKLVISTVQNIDAALLLVLCLVLAAALVWALDLLLKKH